MFTLFARLAKIRESSPRLPQWLLTSRACAQKAQLRTDVSIEATDDVLTTNKIFMKKSKNKRKKGEEKERKSEKKIVVTLYITAHARMQMRNSQWNADCSLSSMSLMSH